jgi:two-component system, NarL family, sensor kinase
MSDDRDVGQSWRQSRQEVGSEMSSTVGTEVPASAAAPLAWRSLTSASGKLGDDTPSPRRLIIQVTVSAVAVLLLVGAVGLSAIRWTAEQEGLREATTNTDVIAENLVAPAITPELWSPNEALRLRATSRLRDAIDKAVDGRRVVGVTIWERNDLAEPSNVVLASTNTALIGKRFALPDAIDLDPDNPQGQAALADLDRPEHELQNAADEQQLEVFRPLTTAGGRVLLVETYSPYDAVEDRTQQLWRGFAGLTAASLLIFVILLLPLLWRIVNRARSQREMLLQRSIDVSLDERRRIAGEFHDGVVQVLAATTVSMDDLSRRAARSGSTDLSRDLRALTRRVRLAVGGQRSLLVDLYPPVLSEDGVAKALEDLAAPLRAGEVDVVVDVDDTAVDALDDEQQELVRRVAQETLRNAARHARASSVWVRLAAAVDGRVMLQVADDGAGFDAARLTDSRPGHIGTRVLVDLARAAGADLSVRTAPGSGTTWRLLIDPRLGRVAR